jgi:hypothetical protein
VSTLLYFVGGCLAVVGLLFVGTYAFDRWANRRRP